MSTSNAFVSRFEITPQLPGRLSGLTFAVKDLIDVAGYPTSCGNPDWQKTHPIPSVHAVCVQQLLQEGAICKGKTITAELAFSLLGENEHFGTPNNPNAPGCYPGGSSSGSASAVAFKEVDFALGTDTGGSVRVPASNCGIYGFRPTYGRISLAGVNPLAPSFDTVGVFARAPDILKWSAEALMGLPSLEAKFHPNCIYILDDAFTLCDPEVRKGLEKPLEELRGSFNCKSVSLREILNQDISIESYFHTYCAIQWAEIWSSLGSWIEATKPHFGPHVTQSFELARSYDRKDLQECIRQRQKIRKAFNVFLGSSNFLCIPTVPTLPPKIGSIPLDRTKGNYYSRLFSLTSIAPLCNMPQVTLPWGDYQGIKLGISILGGLGKDEELLQAMLIQDEANIEGRRSDSGNR